jgi:hypothetical protein
MSGDRVLDRPVGRPVIIVLQVAGLVGAAALGWHFLRYLWHAIVAIRYPFGLDYGEGIVWQQALLIPGPRMYGDITRFPFIVFHYPPVYHLAVRILAATGVDMLAVGRSISVLSALTVGAVVARLAFLASPNSIGRTAKLTGSVVAGLTVFCYDPVVVWSMLMRVDLLAVALSFLAVWCVVTSVGRPWRLYAGAFLFLAAMFTKQTSIAAPLATFPVMLLIDRRRTLAVSAAVLLAGLALLLLLNAYTDGGFLRHIVLYNINRYQFSAVIDGVLSEWPHAVFLLITVIGVASLWRRLASERRWQNLDSFKRDVAENIVVRTALVITLYLIVTTCMIATIGKSGASDNYLIEGMCVWSVIIGTLVASCTDRLIDYFAGTAPRGQKMIHPFLAVLLGWLLALQMMILPTSSGEFLNITPGNVAVLDSLTSRIANTQTPVLSDDMVLLLRAGKEVPWEPAIFAELASQGRWDQRLIIDRIEAHAFAMIVTTEPPGTPLYASRYLPDVSRAIDAAYPRTEIVAGRTLHLPAD